MLEPFDALPAELGHALERAFPPLPWRDGEPFPLGPADSQLVIVRGGLIAAMAPSARGRQVAVALLEPGDVYPAPSRAGACALRPIEDAWVSVIARRGLTLLMQRAPAVGLVLLEALADGLGRAGDATRVLCEMRVEDRLMGVFGRLATRHGVVTPEGIRLTLMLSHSQWGMLVGASREAVTAALLRLRRRGEVACRNRMIILPPVEPVAAASTEALAGAA